MGERSEVECELRKTWCDVARQLIRFSQLLAEWEREAKSENAIEKARALEHHQQDALHLRR
jgi:hypothetical protein